MDVVAGFPQGLVQAAGTGMLIDDLIAGGAPASGTTIAPILERLRAAHKFAIAPDATAVADALANDYGGLTRAFAHCRIPFAETWLEFAHMDRPNFANAPVQAPHFQMRPHRVGYLLSALRNDLSAWKAHLFWSINDNQCSTAPMAMTFDMTRPLGGRLTLPTEEQNARRRLAQQQRGIVDVDQVDVHPGWKAGTDAQRLTMLQHTLPTTTDFPPPPPLGLITKQERDRFYEMVMDLAASDWAGEPSFLLALVGLLNARNAVETELVDQARLNRARVKRG